MINTAHVTTKNYRTIASIHFLSVLLLVRN